MTAFCAVTRPTRTEIAQLDDLTRPLFDATCDETRRYASAALCGCNHPPPCLIRRLCREPVETAAPLIVRSPAISDADLVSLIGSHGLPHARAIARRPNLNKAISDLLRLLGDPETDRLLNSRVVSDPVRDDDPTETGTTKPTARRISGLSAEQIRDRLKQMMLASSGEPADTAWSGSAENMVGATADRVFKLAMDADQNPFLDELARLLGIPHTQVKRLTREGALWDFMVALKALETPETMAFAITALTSAEEQRTIGSAKLFFRRYAGIRSELARRRVIGWRGSAVVDASGADQARFNADNDRTQPAGDLKAS